MSTAPENEATITRLGSHGDGIAETPAGPQYVPFALPGERWQVGQTQPPLCTVRSPQRQAPVCRHFGLCGGCRAQHMAPDLYRQWKQDLVVEAFRRRGLDPPVAPMRGVAPGARRRAVFGVARVGGRIVLGFHERGRHALVDLNECAVLDPAIVAVLQGLRTIADTAFPAAVPADARLVATRTGTGLDVAATGAGRDFSAAARMSLARSAQAARLVRLTIDGDVFFAQGEPTITFGKAAVVLPPGAFLQATSEAEATMVLEVMSAVGKARRVADLFCGLGTFTFPLAAGARVLAADSEPRALAALATAARRTQGLKPIETRLRDLLREPLSPNELAAFDAVVFDPPHGGAKAQAERLARSRVPLVVAISCNPATLARDARILIDGGYDLQRVRPIDQFLFSAETEAVAVFRR
ncbi:MAG: class I SAM-dependent RNA methyltransferase [Hyphomicrobiaceae bacterium]